MIKKKYISSDEYEESHKSSAVFIGVIISIIIIFIFAIIIGLKYFGITRKSEDLSKAQNNNLEKEIAAGGEELLAKLQDKVKELNSENEALKKSIETLRSQNEQFQNKISKLNIHIKDSDERIKELMKSKADQLAIIDELKNKYDVKQKDYASLQNDMIQLRGELQAWKNKYNDVYNKLQIVSHSEDEAVGKLLEQFKKTYKELNLLKNENAELKQEIKTLQKELDTCSKAAPQ